MTIHELAEEDIGDRDAWRNLGMDEGKPLYSGQIYGSLERIVMIMMMMIIIIIVIITTQLIMGENCYIASTQWKLKTTQEMRFSTPRNVRYIRELQLGMKRRRNSRKGR
jgi:hypothetical protein